MPDSIGVDDKNLRLIQNLYIDQITPIRMKDNLSEWVQVNKEVK